MNIEDINPWWKTSEVETEYRELIRRGLFNEISPYLKERQIIAINGLRRTGKTVLMHHIIDFLLRDKPKENISYYNFDLFDDKIENILKSYGELVNIDVKKEEIFVFLDEIQKHKGWENELKVLYDNYRKIKFFVSGSNSLFIEKKTKESLGGWVFSFTLEPLTFKEYLELKKTKIDYRKVSMYNLYRKELNYMFKHYLLTGGFPELIDVEEKTKVNKYVKELVIDRIIYIDIPKVFEIEEPELLARILSIISANPGMIVDYESLADDMNRNRKTISNYIFYLEKAFLIKKLYNYSKNLLTSEKKLKRVYPSSTAFANLFNAEFGKIIESSVLMHHNFRFFSRIGEKEVDFIEANDVRIPIEIKYSDKIKDKEIKSLIKFLEKHKSKEGIVITSNYESERNIKGKTIKFVPILKYLLSYDHYN